MKRWVYNSNLFSAFRLLFFRRGFRSLDLRLFLSSHWQLLRLVLSCFFDLSPSIWDLVNLFRCSTCLRLGSPRLFQKVITSWPSGTWWIAIMLNGIEGPVRPSWPPQRLIIINWYSCVLNLLNLRSFWMLSRKKCSESQIFFISFRDLGSPSNMSVPQENAEHSMTQILHTRASWIKFIDSWNFLKRIPIICLLLPTTCAPLKHSLWFPMAIPHSINHMRIPVQAEKVTNQDFPIRFVGHG